MKIRAILATVLLAPFAWAVEPATRPDAAAPVPVAAVWHEISYPPPGVTDLTKLIVGIWSDGSVVTGNDHERGGPPYTSRKIDPKEVEELMTDLDAMKFFTDEEFKKHPNRYPPDASYTAVAAVSGDKKQRISMWRAPTTQPADADHFVTQFVKARKLIEQLGGEKGDPLETIDQRVFRLAR
jgi:hypothetical protein